MEQGNILVSNTEPNSNSNLSIKRISKEELVSDLKEIGVKKGDHLGVALSFKSIGYVIGGPETFIDALLEAVGSQGTIMIPTYTHGFHISKVASGKTAYIFDHNFTPTWTGLVPETLRKRKSAIRSRHPINSVTAIGRLAEYLTEGHNELSRSYMPYSKLAQIKGKILCIGLGDHVVAIRHEAQYQAGFFNHIPSGFGVKYRDDNGKIKIFTRREFIGCTTRLPELVPTLRRMGLVRDGNIGMAHSIIVPAMEFIKETSKKLRANPTLTLCDNISCLWCRELERRMNLYKLIEKPKFFQRYALIIKGIAFINRLRLRSYIADEITSISIRLGKMMVKIIRDRRIPKNEIRSICLRLLKSRLRIRTYNAPT